jgi:hypothetical protein
MHLVTRLEAMVHSMKRSDVLLEQQLAESLHISGSEQSLLNSDSNSEDSVRIILH